MKYLKKTYTAGITIEVQKTYSARYGKTLQKEGRTGKSREAVKRYNEKTAQRKLTRLINANFKPGDTFVTLTYRRGNRPEPEDARKQRDRFLRLMRLYFKGQGEQMKYLGASGVGERGAIHHHFIMNSADHREIKKCWPHGKAFCEPLWDNGEYSALAAYIYQQNRTGLDGKEQISGDRWCCSKNLVRPRPKVEEVSARTWKEPPAPVKGYIIDPDSVEVGFSPVTGIPYMFYRMVKIPPRSRIMAPDGRILKNDAAALWIQQKNRRRLEEMYRAGRWNRTAHQEGRGKTCSTPGGETEKRRRSPAGKSSIPAAPPAGKK